MVDPQLFRNSSLRPCSDLSVAEYGCGLLQSAAHCLIAGLNVSYDRYSFLYLPRPGGKSFSSFCAPLLSLCWFFSCFLLGSIACWAAPIQTSFLTAGSYIPITKVPM